MTDSNISVSSSRDGRAEIERRVDAVIRRAHGKLDPSAERAALLEYLEDRTLTAEELGHIRWATRAAGLNEDIAGPIIEKLRRLSSEEPK